MLPFNFMETFFFLSLGITFVLIFLIVYHFKQRISNVEQKSDKLFEIIKDLTKEHAKTKQEINNLFSRQNMTMAMDNGTIQHGMQFCMPPGAFFANFQVDESDMPNSDVNLGNVEELEDEDEETDSEADESDAYSYSNDDDGDDNDDISSTLSKCDMNKGCSDFATDSEPMKIRVLEDDGVINSSEMVIESEPILTEQSTTEQVASSDPTTSVAEQYKKMSLNELKKVVLSKNLATESAVSKMKKNELLKLLV